MKKRLTCKLSLAICFGFLFIMTLSGCKKQRLEIPEFPLSATKIEEELKIWGVDCKIEEDESIRENRPERSFYNLYDVESGKVFAAISSVQKNGERFFTITFSSFNYSPSPIELKDCKNILAFASRLFGGFENEDQIYDLFIQEYDSVNTEKKEFEVSPTNKNLKPEGESCWHSDVGDATCEIFFAQPLLDEPEEYISDIGIASDWETFFPE